jgi:hypothetical protein
LPTGLPLLIVLAAAKDDDEKEKNYPQANSTQTRETTRRLPSD